jgi:predicted Co/Zn/Cd cation transporter (cation efflux family)
MTKADINIIDDEKIRAKAVNYIKKIRDDCSRILKDLGEETVIDVT